MGEKTKKEEWEERLRTQYPDKSFENEDDFYDASMTDYDGLSQKVKKYEEDNDFIYQKLSENPDVFAFISAILGGEKINVAAAHLHRMLDLEEDTPEYEEYMKGVDKLNADRQKEKELSKAFDENIKKSDEALKRFAEMNGLTEEQMTQFIDEVIGMMRDKIFSGNFDEEFLEKMYRVFNYDTDIKAAEEAGRVEGRNEQIRVKNKTKNNTDGLPTTTASSGAAIRQGNDRERMVSGLGRKYQEQYDMFGKK